MNSLTYSEYEQKWRESQKGAVFSGRIVLITTRASSAAGPKNRDKLTSPIHEQPTQVHFDVENGIEGDRWKSGKSVESQISLTSLAVCTLVGGPPKRWHLFGNNFVVDLSLSRGALPVGSRLALGSGEIEISPEPHDPCDRYEARFGRPAYEWVDDPVHAQRHLRGRYARVIRGGTVQVDEIIRVISVP